MAHPLNLGHACDPDVRPNQLYGYRVHGPNDPRNGHRFNPHKVVMDPYAKSIARTIRWSGEMLGCVVDHGRRRSRQKYFQRRSIRGRTSRGSRRRTRGAARAATMDDTSAVGGAPAGLAPVDSEK
jgi:pullulanase/glycogen debranching enzyme